MAMDLARGALLQAPQCPVLNALSSNHPTLPSLSKGPNGWGFTGRVRRSGQKNLLAVDHIKNRKAI